MPTSLSKFMPPAARAWFFIRSWQPLTGRALLALVLSLYAIKVWALPEADLAAAVIGWGFVALCSLVLTFSLLLRFRLGRRLRAEAHFDAQALSGRPVPSSLLLSGSTVAPFFSLEIERKFLQHGVAAPRHVLRGREPEKGKRYLIDEVRFPHRGVWKLEALRCSLADALGFTRLTWLLPLEMQAEVSAPDLSIRPLPILAASSTSGDNWTESRERSGDLFDIKAYDSSDGIKRILWKTYAKSRQLVVRRPEPAMIPEGEVAVYLIAGRKDDHVAGAAQSYMKQLRENNITVLFGTDGGVSADFNDPKIDAAWPHCFFTAAEEIRKAINYSVWSPEAGTGRGVDPFLESLHEANRAVHVAVFFIGEPSEQDSDDRLDTVSSAARLHFVKPCVAFVPRRAEAETVRSKTASSRLAALIAPRKRRKQEMLLPAAAMRLGADFVEVESHE